MLDPALDMHQSQWGVLNWLKRLRHFLHFQLRALFVTSIPVSMSLCLNPGLGCALQTGLIMFLDLAWGGQQWQVIYPPFVNGKAVRTVKNPDGQLIFRSHDTQQLKETLGRCRRQQYRQPNTSSQHRASVHACKQYVRCIVFSGKPASFTRIT